MSEPAHSLSGRDRREDPPSVDPADPGARCYRHPLRETWVRCTRCDRPICPDCMRPASVGFHCPDDVSLAAATTRRPLTLVGARTARRSWPVTTWSLIALNALVYVATAIPAVHGFGRPSTSTLFDRLQLLPQTVADRHQFSRLITSAFLHVSLLHIVLNMVALAIVGPSLEMLLGARRFLSVYLLAALVGSVTVYVLGSRYTPVAGASGAIFGLFAAALLLMRELRLDPQWLIVTIVLNFVFTFTIPDISALSHIGGFAGGALATLAIVGVRRGGRRERIPPSLQAAGLAGILVLVVVAVIWRTAVL